MAGNLTNQVSQTADDDLDVSIGSVDNNGKIEGDEAETLSVA